MGNKFSRNKGLNNQPPSLGRNRLVSHGRTQSKVTQQDKAVLELKKQRDILKQFQKNVDVNHERESQQVKQYLIEGNRERAKFVLKKKKFREVLMTKTQTQLDNIDQICNGLEFAQIEITVLQSLKAGNVALKMVLDEMVSIDAIDKLLEETREGIDKQNEINKLFSEHLTPGDLQDVELELKNLLLAENKPPPKLEQHPHAIPLVYDRQDLKTKELKSGNKMDLNFPEIPSCPMPTAKPKEAGMSKSNHAVADVNPVKEEVENELFDVIDAETSAGADYTSQVEYPKVPQNPLTASPRNAAMFGTEPSEVEFPDIPRSHKSKGRKHHKIPSEENTLPLVEHKKPSHSHKKKKKKKSSIPHQPEEPEEELELEAEAM